MIRLAVLMTCHDRRETTLSCLDRLLALRRPGVELRVHLTDAGSQDGTAAAVRGRFPEVDVLDRGPELYWNSGMRESWAAARDPDVDGYLWLNDDTLLDPDALTRLLAVRAVDPAAIVVGATRDEETGRVTYSGVVRPHRWRPLAFDRVPPGDAPRPVETMNGNCVLVPATVADRVGDLDPAFTHGMGDFDYGLRARRQGFQVLLAPATVGTCSANPRVQRGPGAELRHLKGPKGLPWREWLVFARRWAGPLWPLYFASPYLRRLSSALRTVRRSEEH